MAVSNIRKYQIIVDRENAHTFIDVLQTSGAAEIRELHADDADQSLKLTSPDSSEKIEYDYANLDFAIKQLAPYAKKRGFLEGPITLTKEEVVKRATAFDYEKIIDQCKDLHDRAARSTNSINSLETEQSNLLPWENLDLPLESLMETDSSELLLGTVKSTVYSEMIAKLSDISPLITVKKVSDSGVDTYFYLVFDNSLKSDISKMLSEFKFSETTDLPEMEGLLNDYIHALADKISTERKTLEEIEAQYRKLAKHYEDLQIAYDYTGWELEKIQTQKKLYATNYSVAISAWIPSQKIKSDIVSQFDTISKEYEISEVEPDEGEKPPVIIRNSKFFTPFESVTTIFGLPQHNELDPTPFLAFFFIVFFALCLTDAGYGILMVAVMGLALKFMKLGDGIKKLVKLLLYGGIVTFFIGALFGGWFGLEASKMPESLQWLTYTTENGETMFIFQQINALTDPITVLILALGLGYIQIVVGIVLALIHNFRYGSKKDAILDHGTWVFMMTGIGVLILASAGVLPEPFPEIAKWWLIAAAGILILTQGRDKKNIFAKFFSGVLSLYGLVGYMSDILSYSRLLALGLATAIIGLAINTIVGLAMGIPVVNWVLVPVIFIGGHIFNLLINALGAFIHSGRLQFVEFFGKFMEGGGDEFQPFSKKSKFVFIKNN